MHKVFFSLLFVAACAFTVEKHSIFSLNRATALDLVELQDQAILGIEENQVFLNPARIILNDQGIFLRTDLGVYLTVSTLLSNSNGCYMLLSGTELAQAPYARQRMQCWKCEFVWYIDSVRFSRTCPQCKTPN